MADLFFPQLSNGAIGQYPIRKTKVTRTVKNLMQDGRVISYADPNGAQLVWQLGYAALSFQDLDLLVAHFNSCQGRLHAFTFIDPTDNMLNDSSNLLAASWRCSSVIRLATNREDPAGGSSAFTVTNNGQTNQELSQTLVVPSGYQYCFSVYMSSAEPSPVELIRSGSMSQHTTTVMTGPQWTRVTSSGALPDHGTTLTVAVSLAPGQQVAVYGPQLEAQVSPSRYRRTGDNGGGVYRSAHWGVDELAISADGPDLFSTAFSIETAI
jgi:Conserved hypothetical protein 2217 (DUF2460)